MGTFRSKSILLLALLSLACVAQPAPGAAPGGDVATIQKTLIEHVMPRRDYVGRPTPRFEWTGIAGVEAYEIRIENEVEVEMFAQTGITGTSVPWPADLRLEPGTYFWRITGTKGGRMIADSGRAAFLIHEP